MSDDGDMYVDDIGRIFCSAHRRAVCHSCFYNFEIMNSMAEERAGLRKCVMCPTWHVTCALAGRCKKCLCVHAGFLV
jgi:hypothetical protein